MGSDNYDPDLNSIEPANRPGLGIGDGSVIENAIVDKNCRIGRNVRIALRPDLEPNCDIKGIYVRDGIIVVPKETILPDGWVL
jgi:glucose-1-phosphate adenylyltransferase